MESIAKGAEADISRAETEEGLIIIKDRVAKGYRITQLDAKIRKERTRLEARLLREAARAGVAVPSVLKEEGTTLQLEFMDGPRVKELLSQKNFQELMAKIGEAIGRLHSYGIVHGDLTTSNMIWRAGKIVLIDFGLGFFSKRPEDLATDLHLLEEALRAAHFEFAEAAFEKFLEAYQKESEASASVLEQLKKIEARGRYVKR